jgi:3-dehydroquinate synthase
MCTVIELPDGRCSYIYTGGNIDEVSGYIYPDSTKIFVLTDTNVRDLYSPSFPGNAIVLTMSPGEKNKTLNTVLEIVRELIARDADRKSFIVGIGGGIVCDVTGFIASIYMRGVRFGFVPTTLMAQVDASVGGKNGVNCDGYKNMIGVFNQPDFVLCDSTMLKTLPLRELRAGLAEVVKSGLIADADLFRYVENNINDILNCRKENLDFIVERSIAIKARIVEADERESGERKKLNLGHTFGHAIEKHSDNTLLHGEAVSVGLAIAAKISEQSGLISHEECLRITNLLLKIGLPVATEIPASHLMEAIGKDKTRQDNSVHFVLNKGIGDSEVRKVSYDELEVLLGK